MIRSDGNRRLKQNSAIKRLFTQQTCANKRFEIDPKSFEYSCWPTDIKENLTFAGLLVMRRLADVPVETLLAVLAIPSSRVMSGCANRFRFGGVKLVINQ